MDTQSLKVLVVTEEEIFYNPENYLESLSF